MKKSELVQMIREEIAHVVAETAAGEEAKKLGLKHMGWGKYADKSGKITHISKGDKLTPVKAQPQGAGAPTPSAGKIGQQNVPRAATPSGGSKFGMGKTAQKSKAPVGQTSNAPVSNAPSAAPASTPKKHLLQRADSYIRDIGMDYSNHKALAKKGLVPLKMKAPGFTTHTRGDQSKYKDWGTITPHTDVVSPYVQGAMKKDPTAGKKSVDHFMKQLVSKGAKPIGTVRGEMGGSDRHPAYSYNGDVYINRGSDIQFGSAKRLRNSSVWSQQKN